MEAGGQGHLQGGAWGGREDKRLTWAALRNGSFSKPPAQPLCRASRKAALGPNSSELDFCRL